MAEEEAIKTDNDSWRFEGETTIGLQPRAIRSANNRLLSNLTVIGV
jgi:hypothetical protein